MMAKKALFYGLRIVGKICWRNNGGEFTILGPLREQALTFYLNTILKALGR